MIIYVTTYMFYLDIYNKKKKKKNTPSIFHINRDHR